METPTKERLAQALIEFGLNVRHVIVQDARLGVYDDYDDNGAVTPILKLRRDLVEHLGRTKARPFLDQSLELDPDLAEAHAKTVNSPPLSLWVLLSVR